VKKIHQQQVRAKSQLAAIKGIDPATFGMPTHCLSHTAKSYATFLLTSKLRNK
jgi:hypothetical protein